MIKNAPSLWQNTIPSKGHEQHKYDHGHALIFAAPDLTGATHLAATACARIGAGLVSVIAPHQRADLYRTILPPHILVREEYNQTSKNVSARLYGPGGVSEPPDYTMSIATVLDADALYTLPETLSPSYILTPHRGEFDKAFPDIEGSLLERGQTVAEKLNCHLILKGPQTLIIAPDKKTVINKHASPWLATAGSGDVLAGIVTGLLAQHMPIFDACCASVWIHGDLAQKASPYLVASDLAQHIPATMQSLIK